jgi:hypothetical protein
MKSGQNKRYSRQWNSSRILQLLLLIFAGGILHAQEDMMTSMPESKPVKKTFESIWLMNQQTVMVPFKNTFQMDFQHRFGTWDNGYKDLYGIFAPSNIRIGFDYVPADNLMVGFGFSNQNNLWDGFAKYALLKQKSNGGTPVSLTYYVNAAIDTREKENTDFEESTDRWSFFHQLMVARKFSEAFSLQVAGNLSWFNYHPVYDAEGNLLGRNKNATFSIGGLARYKFSKVSSLIIEYDQPITDQKFFDPEPNLSFGFEVVTSSHAFQVFVGNYQSLIPQYNHSLNDNSFGDNQILIGFNLTRLWNF